MGCPAFEVAKALLFAVLAPLLRWGVPSSKLPCSVRARAQASVVPSKFPMYWYLRCSRPAQVGRPTPKFPKYCYLKCSRPCPAGVSRPRSYQSIAIRNVRRCPGEVSGPRSYQSIAIHRLRAPAQVGSPAPEITKVLKFIGFASLPKWGVPHSKL